jgi:hypothetical protein
VYAREMNSQHYEDAIRDVSTFGAQ